MRIAGVRIYAAVAATLLACGDDHHEQPAESVDAGTCSSGVSTERANALVSTWTNAVGDELSFAVQRALLDPSGGGVCVLIVDIAFRTMTTSIKYGSDVAITFNGPDSAAFETTVNSMANESGVVVSLPLEGYFDGTSWAVTVTAVTRSTILFTQREP